MDFLKEIINVSGNKFASKVEDGLDGSDVCGYIDTGSYTFNALLSGSLFDGLPSNKITCLAGESATGKTYFSIGVVAQFLAANPEGIVLYFDTEQAVTSDMFTERGVDPKRIAVFPVETVEEFRHQCLTIVDKVLATDESERKPMMIVLDSLGMLSTSKEMNDVAEGKNVRDMTRAQVIKGTFRVLTLKLGKAKIPMIMTNHTYDVVGAYVPTKELGGGSGLKYAASTIVTLSKKKDKQDDEVVGNIITCKLYKSRLTKENKIVQVQLNFDSGLNRYYGLVDLALDYGIFKKNSTKIELPDGTKAFEKHINEEPEKYFTQEILKQIDERVQEDFKYG
jgi:RecA/RadA recombinase